MTQTTDTELRDLLTGMREEMRLGFSDIKGDINTINTRLTEIEKKLDKLDTKIDKQDNRLWVFGGMILATALGTIYRLLAFPST